MVSATSTPDNNFFCIAETTFKEGFRSNRRDSHHKKYANSTELSKYMWKLENEIIASKIKCSIKPISHDTPRDGLCKLCLTEKVWLLKHFNDENLLNEKSELINKCRHENTSRNKQVGKG